jgi:hypothetical protein
MEELKAVLICGDRNWKNREAIKREILKLPKTCIIIEGGARGADLIAYDIGTSEGFHIIDMPADWETYGRSAGPIRNGVMLKELLKFKPDVKVLAFHENIEESKGTKNMVTISRKNGVNVEIFVN